MARYSASTGGSGRTTTASVSARAGSDSSPDSTRTGASRPSGPRRETGRARARTVPPTSSTPAAVVCQTRFPRSRAAAISPSVVSPSGSHACNGSDTTSTTIVIRGAPSPASSRELPTAHAPSYELIGLLLGPRHGGPPVRRCAPIHVGDHPWFHLVIESESHQCGQSHVQRHDGRLGGDGPSPASHLLPSSRFPR